MNLSMALANHSHDTLSFAQPSPLCQSFCWSLESIPCVRRGHWIGIPLARLRTRLQLSEKSDRAVLVRGSRPGCRLHLRVSAFRRDTADGPLRWPRLLRGDSRGGLTTSDAGTVHLIIGGRMDNEIVTAPELGCAAKDNLVFNIRSEERRVGKEGRSRGPPYH